MDRLEFPKQVIVLGGGLTSEGQPTQETFERARTAALYAQEYGASRVIFSGGESLLVSGERSGLTEADVMAEEAVGRGLDPASISGLDRKSRSTFETFPNVKPLLWYEPTAIITHAYHQPRSLYMARLALPMPLMGIEAFAEYNGKAKAPFNERVLRRLTRIAMTGVEQGDVETMRNRNDRLVSVIATPARLKLLGTTLLRNHVSVKAVKAETSEKTQQSKAGDKY